MRDLTFDEIESVSGGWYFSVLGCLGVGIAVIWDAAMDGGAPSPDFLVGPASGPTPGNVGGRYPVSALGGEPSWNNMPGGQGSQALGQALSGQ